MPNFKKHFVTGAIVGASADLAWQVYRLHASPEPPKGFFETVRRISPLEVGLFAFGGGCIASIPDFLEPATSPNHRGFFHSIVCFGAVVYLMFGKHTKKMGSQSCFSLRAAALAYLSHLFLDGGTPKGLPLLGFLKL